MQLIANKAMPYAQQKLEPGQEFSATARDARVLVAVGLAREVDKVVVELAEEKPSRRRYTRRDMRAEG